MNQSSIPIRESKHHPMNEKSLSEPLKDYKSVVAPEESFVHSKVGANIEELNEKINCMNEVWTCKLCGHTAGILKGDMRNHIEGKHIEGVSHPFRQCGKSFSSRKSLAIHIEYSRTHTMDNIGVL